MICCFEGAKLASLPSVLSGHLRTSTQLPSAVFGCRREDESMCTCIFFLSSLRPLHRERRLVAGHTISEQEIDDNI